MKQVDGLKKIETKHAQNLLGPRPIRPISGLRIQDSVQLLQEQLHDSVIFYEPCFAKNRTNPHVYVCMFVRNIYYIYMLIMLQTAKQALFNSTPSRSVQRDNFDQQLKLRTTAGEPS